MPRLILNYMRPTAVLLLLLISVVIVCAFFLISKDVALGLPYFYHRFWHKVTLLFIIALLFSMVSLYAERIPIFDRWLGHMLAIALIGWFVDEAIGLTKVGDIFFTFIR